MKINRIEGLTLEQRKTFTQRLLTLHQTGQRRTRHC